MGLKKISPDQTLDLKSAHLTCPLCADTQLHFKETGHYNRQGINNLAYALYQCPSCELISTYPRPTNEIYTPSRDEQGQYASEDDWSWNDRLIRSIKSYKPSGTLLDLGCNAGEFLEVAEQAGFTPEGIEFDEVAAKEAQKRGRKVVRGDFLTMQFEQQYDVVLMNHVLEHIPQVDQVSKALSQIVKPDGVVLINVPNIHGLIAQVMGPKWSILAPHEHIWFFSKWAIHKMFASDFKSIEIFTNTDAEPNGFCLRGLGINVKTALIKMGNLLHLGDEMRVVLRR